MDTGDSGNGASTTVSESGGDDGMLSPEEQKGFDTMSAKELDALFALMDKGASMKKAYLEVKGQSSSSSTTNTNSGGGNKGSSKKPKSPVPPINTAGMFAFTEQERKLSKQVQAQKLQKCNEHMDERSLANWLMPDELKDYKKAEMANNVDGMQKFVKLARDKCVTFYNYLVNEVHTGYSPRSWEDRKLVGKSLLTTKVETPTLHEDSELDSGSMELMNESPEVSPGKVEKKKSPQASPGTDKKKGSSSSGGATKKNTAGK